MAVKISARNLLDETLPDTVEHLLREHQVPSDRLELEITESALMIDPKSAIAVLSRLRSLGVRLAVDDFGVGYSAMTYLKRLPGDQLNIDQSFITHVADKSADAAIVRSCIELGRNPRAHRRFRRRRNN
jgi:EAL domain-containing protein (putative c-di-GMP-specific phosphodiesterase class I)